MPQPRLALYVAIRAESEGNRSINKMKTLFIFLVLMPTIICSAQNARLVLLYDEIPAAVPINDFLKAGDMLGFREFLGTNKTENVYATWTGGDMIEFSNGIGLAVEDKTIGEIIQDMDNAIETMYRPSFDLDDTDARVIVSTDKSKALLSPENKVLRQIKARHERLQKMGYKRVWYFKSKK